nr:MAG TPA: hypothetical protein [Caudoviricetes sp.]
MTYKNNNFSGTSSIIHVIFKCDNFTSLLKTCPLKKLRYGKP